MAWLRLGVSQQTARTRSGEELRLTYRLGVVRGLHTLPVEQEPYTASGLALSVAEGIHQLLQLGCPLDLEEDFVVVVGDLDIEMLRRAVFWLLGAVVG